MRRLSTVTVLLLALVSCRGGTSGSEAAPAKKVADPKGPVMTAHDPAAKPQKTPPSREALKVPEARLWAVAKAINTMGSKVLGVVFAKALTGKSAEELASTRGPVISPWSIASAFALAWPGARGRTETEFRTFIPVVLKAPDCFQALGALQRDLEKVSMVKLKIANALWLEQSMPIEPGYLTSTARWFGAAPNRVDFITGAPAVTRRINGWVAKKTNDRIKQLIPAGALGPLTRAVLTNAVWFLAKWRLTFKKRSTRPQPFFPAPGYQVMVQTMWQKNHFQVAHGARGEALVGLSYRGGRFVFYAWRPPRGALQMPAEKNLETLIAGAKSEEIRLLLPRFALTNAYTLGEIIRKLGMSTAFSARDANFRGITRLPAGIFLSEVFHDTYIRVDEEGTEAAAATALTMSVGAKYRPVPEVRFDRPFYFFIRDKATGLDLFTGWVFNPDPTAKVTAVPLKKAP